MAQAAVPDLVKTAPAGLNHAKLFTTCKSCHGFGVNLSAVLNRTPEQHQFAVTLTHFRADVGNQAAGVDAGVDVMQGAADLFRLAIVERPRR